MGTMGTTKCPLGDTEQEGEPVPENHKIGEDAAENEQARRAHEQRAYPAAFVPVQTGCNKGPELVENPWGRQKDRPYDGQLNPDDLKPVDGIENVKLRRIAERLQRLRGRPAHETPQRICERKRNDVGNRQAKQCPEQAGAQLCEVFKQRHAQHVFFVVASHGRSPLKMVRRPPFGSA